MDKIKQYLPKMISVRYSFNDHVAELVRDKVPDRVRQELARDLYKEGKSYNDLLAEVRGAYKLVSSGNVAKYKLV